MAPNRGGVRLVRLAVFAAVVLGLGVAGHALGGGGLPTPAAALLGGIASVLVAVALTGRRVPTRRLVGTLAALQGLLHLLFHHVGGAAPVALAPSGHGVPDRVGAITSLPGHASHAAALAAGSGGAVHDAGHAGAGLAAAHGLSLPMLAFHAAATLAAAWVMARGEAALWASVGRLFPPLPSGPAPLTLRPLPLPAAPAPPRPPGWLWRGSITVRGPPLTAT